MVGKISTDICDLLSSALRETCENFEITQVDANDKGQGYLGEISFISLKHKKTSENHHFVIKQPINSTTESTVNMMSGIFFNEIYFYSKIIPTFRNFQKSYPKVESFENVAKCYATDPEPGKEKIILEDLKVQNYKLHPKNVAVSSKMYEGLFKMYGKYHGLSYAFKHYHPDQFLEMGSCLKNNVLQFVDRDFGKKIIQDCCNKTMKYLEQEGETKIAEKFQKYVDNGANLFKNVVVYKSPYSVILHGDCWSNNFLFKFNELGDIEDIKMLDFQMILMGSPVTDLSYNFYSGASKETLDNLESFLKLYHNTLSETLRKYGCDPEIMFPYEALKQEWKKCIAYSLINSLIVWAIKLTDPDKGSSITESIEGKAEGTFLIPDEEKYKVVILDLCRHLYKNDLL